MIRLRAWGWCKRGCKALVAVVVGLALAGILYEQHGRSLDRKRFPRLGKSVEIGSRSLNLSCSGEGPVTVVFESGGHTAGYNWVQIQRKVAQFTRACWYDRAGYGWSDPGPNPRTSAAIAEDLHHVLEAAAISGPYILVGANFGTFAVRAYTAQYPNQVIGVVLLDGSNPDTFAHETESMKGWATRLSSFVRPLLCGAIPIAGRIGLVRLMLKRQQPWSAVPPKGMTADDWRMLQQLSYQPTGVVASSSEGCSLEGESAAQVRAAGGLGDRPLIVLASATPTGSADFDDYWVRTVQPGLAKLSSRGRLRLVAESTGFGTQNDAPNVVVEAIREVFEELAKTPVR